MIADYAAKGYWGQMTLADFWDRNAAADCSAKEALVDHKARVTWAEAKQWIDNVALSLLSLGLARDSVVVVQLPNWVELPLLRVCCEKAGLLCLPVLRSLRESEMAHVLRYSRAKAIVIPWKFRGFDYDLMVRELRPVLPHLEHVIVAGDQIPDGTISLQELSQGSLTGKLTSEDLQKTKYPGTEFSLVLLTSGSTGVPKLVEHPICSRVYVGRTYMDVTRLSAEDIIAILAPAFVGPNSLAYYGAPQAAAKTVMLEHFDVVSALQLMERERVTIIGVVPTQLALILAHPHLTQYDLSSLRLIICTGSPLPFRVAVEAEEKLKAPLMQFYGSVDGGGSTFPSLEDSQQKRHLTVGKPIAGVQIKLIADDGAPVGPGGIGEAYVRGPTMLSGYFRDPDSTSTCWTPDGWFKSGDYGKWDTDGNLVIVGRKKDMIIRGGQNIYPAEIENLLLTHPQVKDVAVVGMSDDIMGEKACAFIVPKNEASFSFEEMVGHLKSKEIAAYKLPERLELVESLPMVAGEQKINKTALRQNIENKLKNEG